ncbi:MAG: AraC family transcriptional regulator [Ruminococcaceae bacterium]|nr:AraC family transcriptional regulator [Oscillospiraceae bacterium]
MKLLSHYIENQKSFYPKIVNWENYAINDTLFYSYRSTHYDRRTHPSQLHYHDYYELVVFEGGDVKYLCESSVYHPKSGDVILIPPQKFHCSMIKTEETHYKRHVFYFYPETFDGIGQGALLSFTKCFRDGAIFTPDTAELRRELLEALDALKLIWQNDPSPLERSLGLSYIIKIFYIFNKHSLKPEEKTETFPENLRMLQGYIDENYRQITSVSDIAKHFFYSREYVSRLFKKYFDITISDYIMKRRVAESQMLISQGVSLIDTAYRVGFGSLSTFIRAFRSVTGMTPSEYRKLFQ